MANYQLIIIIGLPCSGKTTLSQKYASHGYHLFDDFITSFCDNNVVKMLEQQKKVCLNDPRLCNVNVFNKYMYIFEQYVNKDNILLILMNRSVEQCLQNNIDRLIKNSNKNVEYDIHKLSKIYNLDNYKTYTFLLT